MINVGLIGIGYIGGVHLGALSRLGGVKVAAIYDVNKSLSEKAAEIYEINTVAGSIDEIMADPNVQVVHNCTPNKYHYEITKKAIKAKKHILSEKPLAMTLAEAKELTEMAENAELITGVDFCYRYYPVVQDFAARIQRGDLGDVRMATGTWFQDWLSYETDYTWRLEKSESGESNITADLGSHWFDLIQFCTGLQVSSVRGDFMTIIPRRKKPKRQVLAFERVGEEESELIDVELEEYSSVQFRLSNNAPGSFTTSQICQGRKSDTEFQIYGSKSSMAWNHSRSNELWIGYKNKLNEILIENPILQVSSTAKWANLPAGHPLGYHDAVLALFTDYYDAIKNNQKDKDSNRPTFRTGYDEMVILDAILRSVKEEKWINVQHG